jgi:hypothetical protein
LQERQTRTRKRHGVPCRTPWAAAPDDAGWHIEGSNLPKEATLWHTNLWSKGRALLMHFLFTEVTQDDAPRSWSRTAKGAPRS